MHRLFPILPLLMLLLTGCSLFGTAPVGDGSATATVRPPRPETPDATGGLSKADALVAKAYVLWDLDDVCTDPEKAISLLNSALDIEPRHARALFYRGLVFKQFGAYQEAITNITQAIAIKPQAEYYAWRAYLLMGEGNVKGARLDLMHGRRLNPEHRHVLGIEGVFAFLQGDERKACMKFRAAADHGASSWLLKAKSSNMCRRRTES